MRPPTDNERSAALIATVSKLVAKACVVETECPEHQGEFHLPSDDYVDQVAGLLAVLQLSPTMLLDFTLYLLDCAASGWLILADDDPVVAVSLVSATPVEIEAILNADNPEGGVV